jgi:hypothetical protein
VAETVWRRSPDVAVVDRGDRVVLLALADPATARPLVLEGPAAAIWRALEEARTAHGLVEAVASDVGLPATDIETDVLDFLRELSGHGLVMDTPEPPGP